MPHAFRTSLLRAAHTSATSATDDATLFQELGHRVVTVDGDPRNIHVTTPAELELIRRLRRKRAPTTLTSWSSNPFRTQPTTTRNRAGAIAGSRPRSGAPISAGVWCAAAIDEFATRGYHKTSVEDIVRRARTSRTAFYAFFDNREDAMYGALQRSLRRPARSRALRDPAVRAGRRPGRGRDQRPTSQHLVADPAAATIVLLEGVATSPEVNGLRSRVRRELADLIRDMWAEYDPVAAAAPQARAVSVGLLGIVTESMVHLIETGRLAEAPEHVPALVVALERVFAPRV